jgi:hypothetical protein
MSASSAIESLRRLAPVSDAEAAAVFGAGREELLAGLASGRPARRGRRRRPVLAVAVLALAVIATAATWDVLRAPARETTSVQCLIGNSDAIIPSASGDPAYDCALGWQQEYGTPPPPLVAYDNGLGGVTVIPRSGKPHSGWTRLPRQSQDVALVELQESLDDVVNGLNSSCFDGAAATRLAEAKLGRFGFGGWTVTVRDPDAAARPGNCVSAEVLDPAAKTVTLIPMGALSATGTAMKLADELRPLAQSCRPLSAAVAAVESAGSSLGLTPAPPATVHSYDLASVADPSLRCASIVETVGGTIFVTVRGPSS